MQQHDMKVTDAVFTMRATRLCFVNRNFNHFHRWS